MEERSLLMKLTKEELREMRSDLAPPSAEDVSLTFDGRRRDSKEAVLEFLASVDAPDR